MLNTTDYMEVIYMDKTEKVMSFVLISATVMSFTLIHTTAASMVTSNTPLYTYRMEQVSSEMNFLPTEKSILTYTSESQCWIVYNVEAVYVGGEACYPDICRDAYVRDARLWIIHPDADECIRLQPWNPLDTMIFWGCTWNTGSCCPE